MFQLLWGFISIFDDGHRRSLCTCRTRIPLVRRQSRKLFYAFVNQRVTTCRTATNIECQSRFGIFFLYSNGLAEKLPARKDSHRNPCCPYRVALGLKPARKIDRQFSVREDHPLFKRKMSHSAIFYTHGFIGQKFIYGKTIVNFREIQVIYCYSSLCVSLLNSQFSCC